MANSNDAPNTAPSQLSKKNSKNPEKKPEDAIARAKRTSFVFPSALTFVIAAIAFIMAGYAIYQNKQLNQQKQITRSVLDTLVLNQHQANKKVDGVEQTLMNTQTTMQKQIGKLNEQLQSTLRQQSYQKEDWLLLKARYYLELARINAHWSDNQYATLALLEEADTLLKSNPDQRLYAVRQAIAMEMARIKAMPAVDIAGIMSKLDAAQAIISRLPVRQTFNTPKSDNPTAASTQNGSPAWRERLRDSLNLLEKLVVVRYNNEDIKPLLSPLHQALLQESIRMNLQEAQWAVLRQNTQIFKQSINQAMKDITRTFEQNAPATQALMKDLQSLKETELSPTKPVIDKSLPLLNQVIESNNTPAATPSRASEKDS
ncbi:uroporphyrinogen-III C-methyltransferase [Legionella spiritensis]|uniref:Uroporphyrinogen III methylase n=1 Tax=Legionella spiritensis TaxID=452 RepID=A0A0W0Z5C6_LEGSP|nr:uroporphyrinogen-III C-methyltransferase [Legionella spiritensis]KTD64348.1 uroporphyrinogen III methylase [Legionella spiritensis]SNV46416.1 uroporphyrin-III C-methyltransferase [Legionella spiritensis]VEG91087.1 uroporphyrin-III C-methyltransferase [Legionella spiritensis]